MFNGFPTRSAYAAALFAGALPWFAGCGGGGGPGVEIAGSDAYDVERYDLAGEYDWGRDRLVATVGIVLTTTEPGVTAVTLDSRVTAVRSVRGASGGDLRFSVDAEEGTLTVDVSSLGAEQQGARVALVIDYEAASGDSLRAVPSRPGDPVATPVVFTDSEPQDTSLWMPCRARPDDRAFFSADMRMAGDETLISNGDLVLDEGSGDGRRMRYETQYPLPAYLMAFAIGDFEVEEAESGGVPLSIWHRPGVAGDYPATLADLQRLLDTFQPLVGPYPFEKCAFVMLPEFGGGMENAGITFQSELSTAQPALTGSLMAHELGHQWFGDAVTLATWDDLWIKEGMATLLANEATRPFEDRSEAGVLFGDRCHVTPGEAARDTSLAPANKYTSGPYDRGAWIFTQIRSVVGEGVFWATLRQIVDDHRFGTVSTEQVLSAFAPHLGEAATVRARAAVDAKDLPGLEVEPGAAGGAVVTLRDPQGILIAPVEIEWLREDGTSEKEVLVPDQPMELGRQSEGDLLVLDPADVHPDLSGWAVDDLGVEGYFAALAPLRAPASKPALAAFSGTSGVHQYAALMEGVTPPISPEEYPLFMNSLDADSARASMVDRACQIALLSEDPAAREQWLEALEAELAAEPVWRGVPYAPRASNCSALLDPLELFAADWAGLQSGLATPALTVDRVVYLSTFDLPDDEALAIWLPAARSAYSLRVRSIAARYVAVYARPLSSDGPSDEMAAWRAATLDLLAHTDASEVLVQLTRAAFWFIEAPREDRQAFVSQMNRILHLPMSRLAHSGAVCAAYGLTADDPAVWSQLVIDLADAPLSAGAQQILQDPTVCL